MTLNWREALQKGLGTSYRIQQEPGGGGMSLTYIAEETVLGRSVVLKALSPELAGINADRFEREVRLAAQLQHAFRIGDVRSAPRSLGFSRVQQSAQCSRRLVAIWTAFCAQTGSDYLPSRRRSAGSATLWRILGRHRGRDKHAEPQTSSPRCLGEFDATHPPTTPMPVQSFLF
jgi:serine/threonine protein kinase